MLYLSVYFEQHRSAYYDRLQAVRERGELREWLLFFLTGVAELANDAVGRAERLVDLRESHRQRLSGDRSRAVVDLVFQNPVLTTTRVAEALDTTLQSALNYVRRLEAAGIVSEARGVPGRSKRWISTKVFHAVDPEATAAFSNDDGGTTSPDYSGTTSSTRDDGAHQRVHRRPAGRNPRSHRPC